LQNDKIHETRLIFDQFDPDGAGRISFSDLRELLETVLRAKMTNEFYDQYLRMQFGTTYVNRDVEWDECLSIYAKILRKEQPEKPLMQRTSSSVDSSVGKKKRKREPSISEQFKALSSIEPVYAYNTFTTKEVRTKLIYI
jgi:hypothetical protein